MASRCVAASTSSSRCILSLTAAFSFSRAFIATFWAHSIAEAATTTTSFSFCSALGTCANSIEKEDEEVEEDEDEEDEEEEDDEEDEEDEEEEDEVDDDDVEADDEPLAAAEAAVAACSLRSRSIVNAWMQRCPLESVDIDVDTNPKYCSVVHWVLLARPVFSSLP